MTAAVCIHCSRPADIVDGARPVCRDCVIALGRVAGDPASAHPDVLARLQERSLDVVHLDTRIAWDRTAPWATPTVEPVWEWTRIGWPGVGDDSLYRGRPA